MKVLFSLTVLLFALSAPAEMGFLDVEDVPTAIQQVAPSVLQVMVPAGQKVMELNRNDYHTPKFAKMLAETRDKHLVTQMEFCAVNNLEVCFIYNDMSVETGFIVLDEFHLATNRHIFWDYIRDLLAEYQRRGDSPPVAFKKAMNRPFPVKIAKDLKTIPSGIKTIERLEWHQNDGLMSLASFDQPEFGGYLASDILLLKTTAPLGKPLKLASEQPNIGEPLYMLGYPTLTTNRLATYGKKESNGWARLSISRGERLDMDSALTRLSVMNSRVRNAHDQIKAKAELRQVWEDGLLFTDADAEYGSSGSPVVNFKGEVVAIQSAFMLEYRGALPGLTITFSCPLVTQLSKTSLLELK